MDDNKDKIEEIKKRVTGEGLYIRRVPTKVRELFINLANEEFAGDYGFTLKWLLDFREGLLSHPNQILMDRIDLLAGEISQLKSVPIGPRKKIIKSISGRIISEKEE